MITLLLKPIAFPEPEEITHRSHLERWAKRYERRKKIYSIIYLTGLVGWVIVTLGLSSRQSGSAVRAADITYALFVGSICSGPILLFLAWMVLTSGFKQYDRLIGRLRVSNRVCSVCDVVALYEDRYMLPRKEKQHKKADLVPHMNLIKEAGVTHVLCDACLAEMNASDAGG
ncbi:MAG: hypothetical protein AAF711_06440 [Planctomycetota bacterium]